MPELLVKAALLGDLRGLPERVLGTLLVPGAGRRIAKPHQERIAVEIVDSTRLEPETIEARSLLVGVDRCCTLSAARGVIDGNVPFRGGSGQDEVVRELCERRIRRAGWVCLQRSRDPKVQLAADRSRQRRIEHIADQRVREPPRPTRRARLHQDMRVDGLVEERRDLARGAVLERRHQVERNLDADHRRTGEKLPARVAEAGKPSTDDRLHALSDAQRLADTVGWPAEASFLGEQPDDLADEQRVSLGLAMDGLGKTVGRPLTRGQFDVARDLIDRESRRIEALAR